MPWLAILKFRNSCFWREENTERNGIFRREPDWIGTFRFFPVISGNLWFLKNSKFQSCSEIHENKIKKSRGEKGKKHKKFRTRETVIIRKKNVEKPLNSVFIQLFRNRYTENPFYVVSFRFEIFELLFLLIFPFLNGNFPDFIANSVLWNGNSGPIFYSVLKCLDRDSHYK